MPMGLLATATVGRDGWVDLALIVDWSNNNRSGAEYCSLVPCLPLARGLAP
jgi:hypothetical protein